MYLLNFTLLICSAKFNSLNYCFLLNYLTSFQFLKTVSVQNSCFSLSAFREFLFIKLHLILCSVVDLLLLTLRDHQLIY